MARKLLALPAIFIVFYLGAHYYIRWKHTIRDDVTRLGRLVECEPNEFQAIQIDQEADGKTETVALEREDAPKPGMPAAAAVSRWEWRFTERLAGEADPVLVRRIASTICELYDPSPIRPGDFRPLRAGQAGRRVARKVNAVLRAERGPVVLSFEFGDPRGRLYPLRFDGPSGARHVMVADLFQRVSALSPAELRNMRVMRLDSDNVQQASLRINGEERFTLERAGSDWKVFVGGKEKGTGSEEAAKFLNRISTLRGLKISAVGYSSHDCARDKAAAVLSLRGIGGREETLRFAYGRAGSMAACSSLGTQRFVVHRDLLPFLDIPVTKVLSSR